MITVRSHYRNGRKVRSHTRRDRSNGIGERFGFKTPVEVVYEESDQPDSLAHVATTFHKRGGKYIPKKHRLAVDRDKIKAVGANEKQIIKHEIGHIADVELENERSGGLKGPRSGFSSTKAGKEFIKKHRGRGKKQSNPEAFADAFAKTR